MRNKINHLGETPGRIEGRRIEIVKGLLSRLDGDIVSFNGDLPDITIEKIGRLMSGGRIHLSVDNSEQCFLDTDSESVWYELDRTGFYGPNIAYTEYMENSKKQAMKEKSYHFCIKLAGQRSRSR